LSAPFLAVGKSSTSRGAGPPPARLPANRRDVWKWLLAALSKCPGSGRRIAAPVSANAEYGGAFHRKNSGRFERASYASHDIYSTRHMSVNQWRVPERLISDEVVR